MESEYGPLFLLNYRGAGLPDWSVEVLRSTRPKIAILNDPSLNQETLEAFGDRRLYSQREVGPSLQAERDVCRTVPSFGPTPKSEARVAVFLEDTGCSDSEPSSVPVSSRHHAELGGKVLPQPVLQSHFSTRCSHSAWNGGGNDSGHNDDHSYPPSQRTDHNAVADAEVCDDESIQQGRPMKFIVEYSEIPDHFEIPTSSDGGPAAAAQGLRGLRQFHSPEDVGESSSAQREKVRPYGDVEVVSLDGVDDPRLAKVGSLKDRSTPATPARCATDCKINGVPGKANGKPALENAGQGPGPKCGFDSRGAHMVSRDSERSKKIIEDTAPMSAPYGLEAYFNPMQFATCTSGICISSSCDSEEIGVHQVLSLEKIAKELASSPRNDVFDEGSSTWEVDGVWERGGSKTAKQRSEIFPKLGRPLAVPAKYYRSPRKGNDSARFQLSREMSREMSREKARENVEANSKVIAPCAESKGLAVPGGDRSAASRVLIVDDFFGDMDDIDDEEPARPIGAVRPGVMSGAATGTGIEDEIHLALPMGQGWRASHRNKVQVESPQKQFGLSGMLTVSLGGGGSTPGPTSQQFVGKRQTKSAEV